MTCATPRSGGDSPLGTSCPYLGPPFPSAGGEGNSAGCTAAGIIRLPHLSVRHDGPVPRIPYVRSRTSGMCRRDAREERREVAQRRRGRRDVRERGLERGL